MFRTVSLFFFSSCFLLHFPLHNIFKQQSSNINEGIRVVLFLLRKDFTRTKTHISKQKQKCSCYALKKHLRRRKSFIRLFTFLYFLCAFLCVK